MFRIKYVDNSCNFYDDTLLRKNHSFFEAIKNIFPKDDSRYQMEEAGQNIFMKPSQINDQITKLTQFIFVANCILNLRGFKDSKHLIEISLWKQYQVMFTSHGQFRFHLKTAGLETLRIIQKQEKFQQKKLKVGTFNIFYDFCDALNNLDQIENEVLRNHLKNTLTEDIQITILGPNQLQNTETGIKAFNQFCFYLTFFGFNNQKLCDLIDLLCICLLFGNSEDQLLKSTIESLNSVEIKQHAKVILQTKDRVSGTIIIMYQLFCQKILNTINYSKVEGHCISSILITEKGDFIKNEGNNNYDLSFVEFVSNYVWLAFHSQAHSYDKIFSSNQLLNPADLQQVIVSSYNSNRIKVTSDFGDLLYDIDDKHLNYFQMNSNIQILFKKNENSILKNLKLVQDCKTKTMMYFVYEKVQQLYIRPQKSYLIPISMNYDPKLINYQPQQNKENVPHCFNSFNSETSFQQPSAIYSKDISKSTKSNEDYTRGWQQAGTNTIIQIKRSIQNYNSNQPQQEQQLRTQSSSQCETDQPFCNGHQDDMIYKQESLELFE